MQKFIKRLLSLVLVAALLASLGLTAFAQGSSGSMRYYLVDGTAITNHMESGANNGLVWMAICRSGGVRAQFRSVASPMAPL